MEGFNIRGTGVTRDWLACLKHLPSLLLKDPCVVGLRTKAREGAFSPFCGS